LVDYGFRCVIAPSFADIFRSNCFKNGLLPIELSTEQVSELFDLMYASEGFSLTVDLHQQCVRRPGAQDMPFEVDSFRRDCLLNGLDDIGITLKSSEAIRAFEEQHRQRAPWVFELLEV